MTASIGIALTRPVDGEDATDALWRLVDRADAAMYEAKQQGRDRVASHVGPRPGAARLPAARRRPPTRQGAGRQRRRLTDSPARPVEPAGSLLRWAA